jgi:tRNA threonylcarbamoyl adenosine modification protein YjeE
MVVVGFGQDFAGLRQLARDLETCLDRGYVHLFSGGERAQHTGASCCSDPDVALDAGDVNEDTVPDCGPLRATWHASVMKNTAHKAAQLVFSSAALPDRTQLLANLDADNVCSPAYISRVFEALGGASVALPGASSASGPAAPSAPHVSVFSTGFKDAACTGRLAYAGKTFFARALLRALGVPSAVPVPSPTFALVHRYDGAQSLVIHADLYRVRDEADPVGATRALGLRDDRDEGAVLLVEWGAGLEAALGGRADVAVMFERGAGERRAAVLTSG